MSSLNRASYAAATAAAQGIISLSDPTLIVDGKWGKFTQDKFEKSSASVRTSVESVISSLTGGGRSKDLLAYRELERAMGATALVTSRNLSSEGNSVRERVKAIAMELGIPIDTAMKIAYLESKFNPKAVSPTGAAGVFQMTDIAIRDVNEKLGTKYTKAEMSDVEKGIRAGLLYVKLVARYMNRPLSDAVGIYMGFNIGPTGAKFVLNGKPNRAANEINRQAYGPPAAYAANLTRAVKDAPVA